MDFPLILLILTVVTGVFWFGDIFVWKKKRAEAARAAVAEFDAAHPGMDPADPVLSHERKVVEYKAKRQPVWLEWTAGLFPVILLVFVVRSSLWSRSGFRPAQCSRRFSPVTSSP